MEALKSLSIARKLGLLIGFAILICAGFIGLSTSYLLSSHLIDLTVDLQQKSARAAALGFQKAYPDFQYDIAENGDITNLRIAKIPEFTNHSMIDAVTATTGDTATIFVWDAKTQDFWRKTTNIKKEDGTRAIGTPLGKDGAVYPVMREGKTYRGEAVILGTPFYTEYTPIRDANDNISGILYVGIDKEQSEHLYENIMQGIAVASLAVFIVLLLLALYAGKRGVKPLEMLTDTMQNLANGNLDAIVGHTDRRDEIGSMANAVQIFKDNAIRVRELEAEQAERDRIAAEQRRADMLALANDFESNVGHVIENVTAAVTQLQASSAQMSSIATETGAQATTVASASEAASNNVQTVAAATEELTSSIGEIGQQVQHSTSVSEQAVNSASKTTETIRELATIANQIGDVIDLINDIANQTNLLALNATIEAARAGDAGKGFAVVAGEVKNLANQTAQATGRIAQQIGQVQSETNNAVTEIEGISDIISNMNSITSTIAAAVEEQSSATQEIARNVELAAAGTAEVSGNIGMVQQAAETTGEAARHIHDAATDLSAQSEQLKAQVDSFIAKIREDATA